MFINTIEVREVVRTATVGVLMLVSALILAVRVSGMSAAPPLTTTDAPLARAAAVR